MLGFKDLKIFSGIFGTKDSSEINQLLEQKMPASLILEGQKLIRNGIGVRKKFGILVYNCALYLPQKTHDATQAIYMDGVKSARLMVMRNISGAALADSFTNNLQEYEAPQAVKQKCASMMAELKKNLANSKDAKAGEVFRIDMLPKVGTYFYLNDQKIAESEYLGVFNESLLKVWLGDKPVDKNCKQGMLGL